MLNKTLEMRIVATSPGDFEALRLTADVYASCVRAFTVRYLEALRGRPNPRYRALIGLLLRGSDTYIHNIVDGLSAPGWKSVSATPAARLARQIVETDGLWFDRFAELARHEGIPVRTSGRSRPEPASGTILIAPEMYRAAANAAGWHLRALFSHRRAWRTERRAWLEERAAFLEAHPEFSKALETWIAPFEKEFTRAESDRGPTRRHGRHWDRWTRWYAWILDHPDITGWRGEATPLAVPTETEVAAIERSVRHPAQRARRRFELLLDKNPELAALEETRLTWIRKYLRFPRPPATKLPGERSGAPSWVAPRDRAYRDLDPKARTVQLQVVCADAGGRLSPQWRTFHFRGDRRFDPRERARRGLPELILATPGRSVASDYLVDRLEDRKAGISGLTLVHRHGVPFLIAALPTSVPRLRIAFRSNPKAKVPADRLLPEDRQPVASLRLVALHLGIEPPASFVACEIQRDEATGAWTLHDLERGAIVAKHSPTLRQVSRDDARRRRKSAAWGTIPRDQHFDVGLSAHRRNSTLQRQRTAAAAVVAVARRHAADMILVADLAHLAPSVDSRRDDNRLLALWNPAGFLEWVEHLARDVGIGVGFSSPWRSTVLCSRCGLPGFRFRVSRKNAAREGVSRRSRATDFGRPELDPAGPEFRCPHCRRTENAAVNAARNHILRLTRGKPAGLAFHQRSGTWDLPDGRRHWNPALAAEEWFASLTPSPTPSAAPPA